MDFDTWPSVILTLGVLALAILLLLSIMASMHEFRKLRITAGQEESLRQVVRRYEQLAENTFDTQQRVAADLAELRTRTASIEQILRTVE
jgi:hypothetical protein